MKKYLLIGEPQYSDDSDDPINFIKEFKSSNDVRTWIQNYMDCSKKWTYSEIN